MRAFVKCTSLSELDYAMPFALRDKGPYGPPQPPQRAVAAAASVSGPPQAVAKVLGQRVFLDLHEL